MLRFVKFAEKITGQFNSETTPDRIRACRSLPFASHRGSAPLASLPFDCAAGRSCHPDDVGEPFPYNPLGLNLPVIITPDRIRTCNLRFRKPTLYPTELRALLKAQPYYNASPAWLSTFGTRLCVVLR